MDTSRYYIKHFWLEYLSAVIEILPYTLETSLITTTVLLVLANILKFNVEGMRINFFLLVISHIVYALGLEKLHIALVAFYAFSVYVLRVYEVPLSKGNIGYRKMNLGHTAFQLFYPTGGNAKEEQIPLFEKGIWNTMYEIINKDTDNPKNIPRWVMYFVTHYYTRMTMKGIFPNAKPRAGTYQVIILSHQLGLNSLYTYARQFADEGYFICSLIHTEEIRNRLPGLEPNRPQRVVQLRERVNSVKRALDFLHNKQELAGVLGDEIKLDYNNIHIMGHSFGGSTALKTAMEDDRITGMVVAMDPCMYILHDDRDYHTHKNGFNKKTLIIMAQDYYEVHYPIFENDYRAHLFRQGANNGCVLAYRLMGANHASFSEMALMAEGQFRAFNVLRNNDYTRLYLEITLCMIRLVLTHLSVKTEQDLLKLAMSQNPKLNKEIEEIARPFSHEEEEKRHKQYESKKRL